MSDIQYDAELCVEVEDVDLPDVPQVSNHTTQTQEPA